MLYYGGGLGAALLMSTQPATRTARLPVVALFLANWGTEQWLLGKLQRFLEVDATGVVYAIVPRPKIMSRAFFWLHSTGRHATASHEHQVSNRSCSLDAHLSNSGMQSACQVSQFRQCQPCKSFGCTSVLYFGQPFLFSKSCSNTAVCSTIA